jgi:radical SAM superfamily enzyme YgiQ (UPF0313 family)
MPPPPAARRPYIEGVHDRGAVEVQRGCSRGCRFCQAGMIYRPVRERPHEEVIKAAGELIANCGYDEVSLVSLNTSDYAGIDQLVANVALSNYPFAAQFAPGRFLHKLVESLPTQPYRAYVRRGRQ